MQLTLTALNLSKTAYASFALDSRAFFIEYDFNGNSQVGGGDRFTCQLYNRVSRLRGVCAWNADLRIRLYSPYSRGA